ncbi:MAG: phosphopyruvate hydratase, partial [Bdellovibrionales bacterium]
KLIDQLLLEKDGTLLKTHLGANTLLGISLACVRAAAQFEQEPLYKYLHPTKENFLLPVPLMNIINGGAHGSNDLDIQEFMIVPFGFDTFKDALRAGCEIFYCLKQKLKSKSYSIAVGDEGGFTPNFRSHHEALDFIVSAIEETGYSKQVGLALDCAASEFYKKKRYHFESKKISSQDLIDIYKKWVKSYNIISIEDGLSEEDWSGWKSLTEQLGDKIQLVGDDLFVTQKKRLEQGLENKIANSLLVKYNQVGTITETKESIDLAKKSGYTCVISHRSGETEDTSIADLSVAWDLEQIKTGSLSRGERTAKYNRLLFIEKKLGSLGKFQGDRAFPKK